MASSPPLFRRVNVRDIPTSVDTCLRRAGGLVGGDNSPAIGIVTVREGSDGTEARLLSKLDPGDRALRCNGSDDIAIDATGDVGALI